MGRDLSGIVVSRCQAYNNPMAISLLILEDKNSLGTNEKLCHKCILFEGGKCPDYQKLLNPYPTTFKQLMNGKREKELTQICVGIHLEISEYSQEQIVQAIFELFGKRKGNDLWVNINDKFTQYGGEIDYDELVFAIMEIIDRNNILKENAARGDLEGEKGIPIPSTEL